MNQLNSLIGEQSIVVIDNPSNRFNFMGLNFINQELVDDVKLFEYYKLIDSSILPEDVKRALSVMEENDAKIEDYTGILEFKIEDDKYYILTW